jgi:broad specificity phosphatase PhoE
MRLVIVRHGRTDANARGLLLGRMDVPLDEVGLIQASRLAAAVGPVDRVISSPLQRAQQTAAVFGRQVDLDDRLIELDYGEFDGLAFGDLPVDTWASWRRDISFRPPGGESLQGLGARVRGFLDELTTAANHETVIVVTHVSPIKAAVAWALDAPDEVTWRLYVAPASITRIDTGDRGSVLRSFNEVSHLDA